MIDAIQGADRVDGELKVDFDERLQRRWLWLQETCRAVAIALLAATLSGAVGRGPFSHGTATKTGSGVAIDYEPVPRADTSTQVTLYLAAAAAPTMSHPPLHGDH